MKCDFYINSNKSYIFSDIGNIQSIKKPYNFNYSITQDDYLILNGYDSSWVKSELISGLSNQYLSESQLKNIC